MARLILLDAGPLWLACSRPGAPPVDRCHAWLALHESRGVVIKIPAIADYEVRRELLRLRAISRLRLLDNLRDRFEAVEVSLESLKLAAGFWAGLRNIGLPTAGPGDLDADAILAGIAATLGRPGDTVEVATTNLKHLARFPGVVAREWSTIA